MKKATLLLVVLSIAAVFSAQAQDELEPPAPGKSVIYIARTTPYGANFNFTYLDSATLLGRCAGPAYIRYECDPGHHVIWARAENRDYVEAELAPDKTYFILATVGVGMVTVQVDLVPINPSKDLKEMERIFKLIAKQRPVKFSPAQLESDKTDLGPAIERGLSTYSEEQKKGVKHDVLPIEWYFVEESF